MRQPLAVCAACLLGLAGLVNAEPVKDLYNYHQIDSSLATAGQLTEAAIPDLASQGYGLVINLATADPERNGSEGFKVIEAGVAYSHIPVAWDHPTLDDLALFFAMMDARGERKTLVHCFANYRASAFTYLYRTLKKGVPENVARADLEAIWTAEAWEENPAWKRFISDAQAHYGQT
jgi:uncharacterized protein (TIGR01244 family)